MARVGGGGEGLDEATGQVLVEVDPRYFRPTEVDVLLGDSAKAREKLGWEHTIDLDTLLAEMVGEDLKSIAQRVPPVADKKSVDHG